MHLATFGLGEALEGALASRGMAELVPCLQPAAEPASDALPAALEAAETALVGSGAPTAVIAGEGDWALAAALACSKAQVPFARLAAGSWQPGTAPASGAAHIDRLATFRICAGDEQLATLEQAGLSAGTVVAGDPAAIAVALEGWLASLVPATRI